MSVPEMAALITERVRISEAVAVACERLRCSAEALRIIGEAIEWYGPAQAPALAHVGHQLLRAIEGKERSPS
jgi:hypothetical protein